jgi:glycosyltransferase involved in cell wall biosynthesis
MPFCDSSIYKEQFGVADRTVLLTFGLLGPGKGIEYAIQALPEIVKRHPNVVYLVLGATHPNLLAREGERYRDRITISFCAPWGIPPNVPSWRSRQPWRF